jgi:hypothetical protein
MKIPGIVVACAFVYTCADRPNLTAVPTLEYQGVSKNKMRQGRINQDTVIIELKFTDGDGDIGYINASLRKPDLVVVDKRTGNPYDNYILPTIPQQGTNNGIRGTMRLTLLTQCCTIQPCDPYDNQPDEALPLEIYLLDRAGNKSNVVLVDDLSLQCF